MSSAAPHGVAVFAITANVAARVSRMGDGLVSKSSRTIHRESP
jgi:hypothetical protein